MSISASLLPEFDMETANTRKALERIPDEKLAFRPHPKSWNLAELATHLAQLPYWAAVAIETDSLDMATAPPSSTAEGSRAELLALFDRNVAAARAALAGASDERLLGSWSLLHGARRILTRPRLAVLRDFVLSHSIHHRGQLTVYLRLNDIPVPAIYGPSADEGTF
ncbi:MAG: DinB family protein [Bryobacteraceae bacterium]